jgi:sortase A
MTTVEAVQRVDRLPAGEPASGPSTSEEPLGEVEPGHATRPRSLGLTALGRHFVEQLLRDAADTAARSRNETPDRVVDWPTIWASAQGADTREQSEGRVVLTAFRAASALIQPPKTGSDSSPIAGIALLERGLAPTPGLPTVLPLVSHPPVDLLALPTPVRGPEVDAEPEPSSEYSRRLRRRAKLATAFGWIRNIGLFAILFSAWQVWGTSIAQHQAQDSLGTQFRSHVRHITPPSASGPHLIGADVKIAQPAEGSVVARIQIPAIGVDQFVVEGTGEGDLAKGPGHYTGTALPGQAGNVSIAGHRTTYGAPFNNLDRLSPGAHIMLTSASGEQLDYVVTQPPAAVPPSDVAVLTPFGDDRLTLTTCNPRFSASQRLVVVALLREAAHARPTAAPKATPSGSQGTPGRLHHIPSGGSVGWNLLYLPGVLAVLGLMALLGLAHKRSTTFFGSRGRWLILTPIWVTATYLLFGLLTSLVPATL